MPHQDLLVPQLPWNHLTNRTITKRYKDTRPTRSDEAQLKGQQSTVKRSKNERRRLGILYGPETVVTKCRAQN